MRHGTDTANMRHGTDTAILWSNQLSYRVQLLSSARSCIYTNSGVRVVIATYHRSDLCQVAMPTTSILI